MKQINLTIAEETSKMAIPMSSTPSEGNQWIFKEVPDTSNTKEWTQNYKECEKSGKNIITQSCQ